MPYNKDKKVNHARLYRLFSSFCTDGDGYEYFEKADADAIADALKALATNAQDIRSTSYALPAETCAGCKWNIRASAENEDTVQVCWLPFKRGGDVHTVSKITDDSIACEEFEDVKEDDRK